MNEKECLQYKQENGKERMLITEEDYAYLNDIVDDLEARLNNLEKESLFFPKQHVFSKNEYFDAYVFVSDLISRAKASIVLIDSYVDFRTLDVLKNKSKGVAITVITSSETNISKLQVDEFNKEYGGLSLLLNDNYHDRYLIINDTYFYHLGSSINYLGKTFSQVSKIIDEDTIELLRNRTRLLKR